jgi:hypothetical protein
MPTVHMHKLVELAIRPSNGRCRCGKADRQYLFAFPFFGEEIENLQTWGLVTTN